MSTLRVTCRSPSNRDNKSWACRRIISPELDFYQFSLRPRKSRAGFSVRTFIATVSFPFYPCLSRAPNNRADEARCTSSGERPRERSVVSEEKIDPDPTTLIDAVTPPDESRTFTRALLRERTFCLSLSRSPGRSSSSSSWSSFSSSSSSSSPSQVGTSAALTIARRRDLPRIAPIPLFSAFPTRRQVCFHPRRGPRRAESRLVQYRASSREVSLPRPTGSPPRLFFSQRFSRARKYALALVKTAGAARIRP